ncbi:MAG: hypothetical protein A3F43_01540 [Gammaproteobacteria bacterium RIFCSPHIGHO2_12_FULL_42_10]|nr:MAG: hypothetical protein A3F43_01540 [Gammaproteobacteria bacterium RIFCSPHIGHO2_12_FULL_42_10]
MNSHRGLQDIDNSINEGLIHPINPDPNSPEYPIGAMRLLVYGEKQRRIAASEPAFNCEVVERNTARGSDDAFVALIKQIKRENPQASLDQPMRMQIIVKQDAHYTTVDLELSKERNRCFVLDAMNDLRMLKLLNALDAMQDPDGKRVFSEIIAACGDAAGKGIQEDNHSCPAYALDHACEVSKLDNIYAEVEAHASQSTATVRRFVHWIDLPLPLIRNAQSLDVAAYAATRGTGVEMHEALDTTFKNYQQRAIAHCAALTPSAAMQIATMQPGPAMSQQAASVSTGGIFKSLPFGLLRSQPMIASIGAKDSQAVQPVQRRVLQRSARCSETSVPSEADNVSKQKSSLPVEGTEGAAVDVTKRFNK